MVPISWIGNVHKLFLKFKVPLVGTFAPSSQTINLQDPSGGQQSFCMTQTHQQG